MDSAVAPQPASLAGLEPAQIVGAHKVALSAKELGKYQQLEQESKGTTQKHSAGAGMDKATIVIIAVVVAGVVVGAASGGGGGGGGGY